MNPVSKIQLKSIVFQHFHDWNFTVFEQKLRSAEEKVLAMSKTIDESDTTYEEALFRADITEISFSTRSSDKKRMEWELNKPISDLIDLKASVYAVQSNTVTKLSAAEQIILDSADDRCQKTIFVSGLKEASSDLMDLTLSVDIMKSKF